jgi:hypothetical protein
MEARIALQNTKLEKTGHNKFAGYKYFELGDFLPVVQKIFVEKGLSGYVSYLPDVAVLTITDIEDGTQLFINSPMASAALKGAHDIQNLGAVQTYLRRYLWVTAMEIVEHDVLDASLGSDAGNAKQPFKPATKADIKPVEVPKAKVHVDLNGKPGEWQIKVEDEKNIPAVVAAVEILLSLSKTDEDVKAIFQNNRNIFDFMKENHKADYEVVLGKFKVARESLTV